MKTGYSVEIITPEIGVHIPGGFAARVSEGVLEDLTVSATAISADEGAAILISVDLCEYIEPFTGDIRKRVAEKTGVPADAIIVTAIHIHTGHATNYQDFGTAPNPEVMKATADKAVKVAVEAWENRTESVLSNGEGTEEKFVFIRNYYMKDGNIRTNPSQRRVPDIVKPVTEPNRTIDVLRFDTPDGKIKEIIFTLACHPDTVGGNFFSTDWPGIVRRELKKKYGEDVAVQFFNGAAGDINHLDPIHLTHTIPAKEGKVFYQVMGQGVAEETIPAVDGAKPVKVEKIKGITKSYISKRRYPTAENFAWAKDVLKHPDDFKYNELIYANEYTEMEKNHYGDRPYVITTVALGDVAIVTAPGELYTVLGNAIKEHSPFKKTLVFELSNGNLGYLSPAEIINSTAYEGTVCLYGATVTEQFADEFLANVQQQLNDLYQALH